jgi:hypothetical protein
VVAATAEMKLACLSYRAKVTPAGRHALKRTSMVLHCYNTTFFVKKSDDGDAESLLALMPFMPPAVSFISVMSLM